MNRVKRILFLFLINVTLITAILYSFESLLSPYTNLPVNGQVEGEWYTWGHLVKNNRYGFRERDFENSKPLGVYRVIVLGDSLTWGAGLAVEERYTTIAEKLLNKAFNDRKFEILNFGFSGGPTVRERDLLLKVKEVVAFDHIVVGYCLNDPNPRSQSYSIEREKLSKSISGRTIFNMSQFMKRNNLPYISKLFSDMFYLSAEKLGLIPTWQTVLQRAYEPLSSEWQEFVQALKDIKSISDELNLPSPIFTILNQGTHAGRLTNYNNSDKNLRQFLQWYNQAEEVATNIGFVAYNHEYEIEHQLKNKSLFVNVLDGHPSEELNRIYGEKLYQEIVKQVIKPQ